MVSLRRLIREDVQPKMINQKALLTPLRWQQSFFVCAIVLSEEEFFRRQHKNNKKKSQNNTKDYGAKYPYKNVFMGAKRHYPLDVQVVCGTSYY